MDIENVFTYHAPKGDQQQRYEQVRSIGYSLAATIEMDCPKSEEREIALQKVREAVMWANASIACNE